MKKKFLLMCFVCFSLLLFGACSSEQAVPKSGDAPDDIAAVLVGPLPQQGFKVAEIDGYDYYYDTHYLFKFLCRVFPETPTEEDIREVIWMELCAVEGHEQGIDVSSMGTGMLRHTYDSAVEDIAALEEGKEHWDEMPDADVAELERSMENRKAMVANFDTMIAAIMEKEGISEEEFFASLVPYEQKYWTAQEYDNDVTWTLYENGAVDEGEDAAEQNRIAVNNEIDKMFEKYNVVITYNP